MKSESSANPMDEQLERAHFESVVAAYRHYKIHTLQRINKSEKIISKLPANHQRRLDKYKTYLAKFKKCVDVNYAIVELIIKDVETMFENVIHIVADSENNGNGEVRYEEADFSNGYSHRAADQHQQHDVEKVQSVLKNLVRDWSEMGAAEREQCYKPIIDEILELFPLDECDPSSIKVLVPGAGLGRMAWEIAARGYTCQGNEFSLFMLVASNFILNRCPEVNMYSVHPWLHQYVNNTTCDHQLLEAKVPDVKPSTDQCKNFSMAAGDFLNVYVMPNEWNCVATCFFIDCAPNVIEFIESIYNILQPGGVWINLGPLLYHYSDLATEDSIEPPYDILLDIIKDVGFVVVKERSAVKTKYAQNPNSMLQYEYDSVFFVCKKPAQ